MLKNTRKPALRTTKYKAASEAQSTELSDAPPAQSTELERGSPSRLRESAVNAVDVEVVEVGERSDKNVVGGEVVQKAQAQTIDVYGKQAESSKLRSKFRLGDKLQETPKKSSSTQRFDIYTPNRAFDSKIIGFSSAIDLEDFFPSPPSSPPAPPLRRPCAPATFNRSRL